MWKATVSRHLVPGTSSVHVAARCTLLTLTNCIITHMTNTIASKFTLFTIFSVNMGSYDTSWWKRLDYDMYFSRIVLCSKSHTEPLLQLRYGTEILIAGINEISIASIHTSFFISICIWMYINSQCVQYAYCFIRGSWIISHRIVRQMTNQN